MWSGLCDISRSAKSNRETQLLSGPSISTDLEASDSPRTFFPDQRATSRLDRLYFDDLLSIDGQPETATTSSTDTLIPICLTE